MTPPRNKRNKENGGLPRRWRLKHGAYYFRVPPGQESAWNDKKEFLLGRSLGEAHRTFSERVSAPTGTIRTIGDALDRYAIEVLPTKAPKTQREHARIVKRLKLAVGANVPSSFKPTHAYAYRDRRVKESSVTNTNHELQVLSHAFTKMIEWGVIEEHPMTENKFRKTKPPPRDRYIEDWEIAEALSLKPRQKHGGVRMCQAYIKLKLATGFRRTDLLRLAVTDLLDDGIHVQPSKTKKKTGRKSFREWTPALREIVKECLAARPLDISPYVFCNRRGEPYFNDETGMANGFDSIWARFMDRVLAETKIRNRFQERDLRAKAATDADDIAHAQALLDHSSSATTRRVYRRKPESVKPGKVKC